MALDADEIQRRSTDPTIPFNGADPEVIPGPKSNVELEIAAGKVYGEFDDESTKGRPAQARKKAKTGDAIHDADAMANPQLTDQVGEDHGEKERAEQGRTNVGPAADRGEQSANVADSDRRESAPEGRTSRSGKQANTSGSGKQTA